MRSRLARSVLGGCSSCHAKSQPSTPAQSTRHIVTRVLSTCIGGAQTNHMTKHATKFRSIHTCSLDLSAGEGCLVTNPAQSGGLCRNALKHVHCKSLHNLHALLGYAHIWVHLFEHPVQHGHQLIILLSHSTWLTNILTQFHRAH